jgi:hypothetical protein
MRRISFVIAAVAAIVTLSPTNGHARMTSARRSEPDHPAYYFLTRQPLGDRALHTRDYTPAGEPIGLWEPPQRDELNRLYLDRHDQRAPLGTPLPVFQMRW